jgi:hypothetical protein
MEGIKFWTKEGFDVASYRWKLEEIINQKLTEDEKEKINLGIKKGYIDDFITNLEY